MYVGVEGVNTMNKGSKAMLKVLKVVFVAFTQHCIQSTDLMVHLRNVSKVHTGPLTPPAGKACCSLQSCGFSGSPVQVGSFVIFVGLQG